MVCDGLSFSKADCQVAGVEIVPTSALDKVLETTVVQRCSEKNPGFEVR
jgi:hypothetical protein